MFGRYYHSITTHAPILFRIICLRSLNTESQERIFNQVKQITKATSNKQPNHIISNIIQRLHFDQKERSNDSVAIQESEVEVLAAAVGPMPNTTIKTAMSEASSHYQAHLERISDFLLPGHGVWWRQTLDGIEFLDGDAENDFNAEGPGLMHFRSSSTSDVDYHLYQQWQKCIDESIPLPALEIRQYDSNGDLESIAPASNGSTQVSQNPSVPTPDMIENATTTSTRTQAESTTPTRDIQVTPSSNAISTGRQPMQLDDSVTPIICTQPLQSDNASISTQQPPQTKKVTPSTTHTKPSQPDNSSMPSIRTQQEYTSTTTLGKLLAKLLPRDPDFAIFDKLRVQLKSKSTSKAKQLAYKQLHTALKQKTLSCYQQTKDRNTRNLAERLLRHEWNMSEI